MYEITFAHVTTVSTFRLECALHGSGISWSKGYTQQKCSTWAPPQASSAYMVSVDLYGPVRLVVSRWDDRKAVQGQGRPGNGVAVGGILYQVIMTCRYISSLSHYRLNAQQQVCVCALAASRIVHVRPAQSTQAVHGFPTRLKCLASNKKCGEECRGGWGVRGQLLSAPSEGSVGPGEWRRELARGPTPALCRE